MSEQPFSIPTGVVNIVDTSKTSLARPAHIKLIMIQKGIVS